MASKVKRILMAFCLILIFEAIAAISTFILFLLFVRTEFMIRKSTGFEVGGNTLTHLGTRISSASLGNIRT